MKNANQAIINEIVTAFEKRQQPERAQFLMGFFKTGPGQYAEGDHFLGLSVPETRKIAKVYQTAVRLPEIAELLKNKWHEVRLAALVMLVKKFQKASADEKREIYDFYLSHMIGINNWDLVDGSARYILGEFLLNHPEEKPVFLKLKKSSNLWHRRIAVLSMFPLVKAGQFELPLEIAASLLTDLHDLMHKAVGWMLRNVGDKDRAVLKSFLNTHLARIPRTALRYSIEHFDQSTRKYYLQKK